MTASVEEWKRRYETARLAHEEARAEIERQQAEIEHLRTTLGYLAENISDYPALVAVAEAALKPKP